MYRVFFNLAGNSEEGKVLNKILPPYLIAFSAPKIEENLPPNAKQVRVYRSYLYRPSERTK